MTKTKRTETVEEYDENGRMIRKTVTEEIVEDDVPTTTTWSTQPVDWVHGQPYITTNHTNTSCELQGQMTFDDLKEEAKK